MDAYFSRVMGMGRYPDKTIKEVFCSNRPYFDQILYKNVRFRHEYAREFREWIEQLPVKEPAFLEMERIKVSIELLGDKKVRELFSKLVEVINFENPNLKLNKDLDYTVTLPQNFTVDIPSRQQQQINNFWKRLAIPEINESES
ncbi:hypothetical protein [Desulforamulus aeronauticus]|uniref:Uncharacterized protein n=1 Tax=Desulforamulus aeronauticus DSM 10349 TaxID=1121421 RepID=A0A1M6TA61_9FIRM|nr:hypothetical protein [Desulforamulus aeronauticus]SHK53905.1 hypothetical protein SAMN02745123_02218 [Desulforamulus aeronauticus DSM 10349]